MKLPFYFNFIFFSYLNFCTYFLFFIYAYSFLLQYVIYLGSLIINFVVKIDVVNDAIRNYSFEKSDSSVNFDLKNLDRLHLVFFASVVLVL